MQSYNGIQLAICQSDAQSDGQRQLGSGTSGVVMLREAPRKMFTILNFI